MSDDDVTKLAYTISVTPEIVKDAGFDLQRYVTERAASYLQREAIRMHLDIVYDSLVITAKDGGFWTDVEQTWWQRLRRRPVEQKWVPVIIYAVTADAR